MIYHKENRADFRVMMPSYTFTNKRDPRRSRTGTATDWLSSDSGYAPTSKILDTVEVVVFQTFLLYLGQYGILILIKQKSGKSWPFGNLIENIFLFAMVGILSE